MTLSFRRFLLLVLSTFVLSSSYARNRQNIKFKNYGIPEGLSMSTVFDITQSPDGYIWIATADGLNRFDGYEFKVFKNIPNKVNSLPENYVTALEVDGSGKLWIGTNSGYLCYYDLVKREIVRLNDFNDSRKNNLSKISDIQWDSRGSLWIGTEGEGAFQMRHGKMLRHFNVQNSSLISDNVSSILVDPIGDIWLGTDNGLNQLEYNTNRINDSTFLEGGIITGSKMEGKDLWVSTQSNGRFIIRKEGIVSMKDKEGTTDVSCFLIDEYGSHWVGTFSSGVVKVDKDSSVNLLSHEQYIGTSLVNNVVFCQFMDNAGNIWIGTLSGLSLYRPLVHQFEYIHSEKGNITGLLDDNVYNIVEDREGNIWFCTYDGGLSKLSPGMSKVESFTTSNSSGLSNNSTRVLLEESDGEFWVGTGSFGLYHFKEEERRFYPVMANLPMDYIRALHKTDENTLWVGCHNGLVKYNIEQKEGEVIDDSRLRGIYQIMNIEQGKLLIATFGNGLLELDLNKNTIVKQYVHMDEDSSSISNNNVMCMTRWNKDTILVGSFGGGFSVFDYKKGAFTNFGITDGLSNESIYGIVKESNTHCWFSSNKGLTRFNLRTNEVNNYDRISQVQSLEFNEGAFMKGSNNAIYFGGINGVNFFHPKQIKKNTLPPKVVIQGIRIFEEPFMYSSTLSEDKVVQLKYKQNFVGFEFVGINFSNPSSCSYKYMLEGVDEDWISTSTSRYAKYINLSPGEYTFKVMASNEDGVWTSYAEEIIINIERPYWLKAWFILAVVFLIVGVLTYFIVLRTTRLRNKFQLKVLDMELKALRSQMNPHFIFNSINSIQYYILNKDPKLAYTYLSKFSTLMRLILNNSRVDYITLKEELDALSIYLELEKMRLEDELEFEIEVDPSFDKKKILIPSMIIQPYLENAILHGLAPKEGDRKLTVKMRHNNGIIHCFIEDNGIGRVKAKELNANRIRKHNSAGMQVTKGRLELLNQENVDNLSVTIHDLLDEQGNAIGTRVEIFIPYKEKKDG